MPRHTVRAFTMNKLTLLRSVALFELNLLSIPKQTLDRYNSICSLRQNSPCHDLVADSPFRKLLPRHASPLTTPAPMNNTSSSAIGNAIPHDPITRRLGTPRPYGLLADTA